MFAVRAVLMVALFGNAFCQANGDLEALEKRVDQIEAVLGIGLNWTQDFGKVKELKLVIDFFTFHTCGGKGAYLELLEGQTSCTTSIKESFLAGVTLSWSGDQLGSCVGKLFNVQLDELNFRLRSTDTDDFCPKTLVITLYDKVGKIYRYKADGMNDWVSKDVNNYIRTATKL